MGNIIFVHGTGVRQESYEKTFTVLLQWANKIPELKSFAFKRCVWGNVYGARPLSSGSSIPGYSGKASAAPEAEVVKWWLLYQDPLFELKALSENSDRNHPPSVLIEWESTKKGIAGCRPSPEFQQLLEEHGLERIWLAALGRIAETAEWKDILPGRAVAVNEFFPDFCRCAAEAVMAETFLQALAAGVPIPSAEIRDRIVDHFLLDLKALVRGIRDWFEDLGKRFKGLALSLAEGGAISGAIVAGYSVNQVSGGLTRNLATDHSIPLIGDILYYQARGENIRDFIEREIEAAEPPIFLLAHSLGGIACVDLLIEKDVRRKIAGLITAGSQAPLFYEMDCLVKLPRSKNTSDSPLPPDFPPWLNFHDPNDYLSYKAKKIFKSDKITDEKITSRQPHLMAHSAYWSEKKLWDRIAAFIRDHQNRTA